MGRKFNGLSQRYVAALRQHLKQGPQAVPPCGTAQYLGRRAMALGLETLDLARFHEQALITLVLPGYSPSTREAMVRRAGKFFAGPSPRSRKRIARPRRTMTNWFN